MFKKNAPTADKAVLSVAAPFTRGSGAADLPQRVKILGWGENIGRTTAARIIVDETVAATLTANQELVACDSVPMDYEHQSVPGHPNFKEDPRLSPGSGRIEIVPGEGVFLSAIEYTPNGEEMASSYQDVSAVAHLDKKGRLLWVSSVALTQRGDVAGMEFSEAVAALSARTTLPPLKSNEPTPKPTMEKKEPVFRDLLIELLELKPGESGEITDEEITAAVQAKVAALGAEPAERPKEESAAALAAVLKLERRMDDEKRDRLVADASRDGKVIPLSAALIAQTPVAILSAMIAGLPAGEVHQESKGGKEKAAERTVALSADEKAAAQALGLSEEAYRKGKA